MAEEVWQDTKTVAAMSRAEIRRCGIVLNMSPELIFLYYHPDLLPDFQ
jgi:hypothetical protein